ncbi:MAG: hypothetical protein ACREPH_06060 [Rhodanobacteraceae bacterium]
MNAVAPGLRERRLRALGVEPLRLRRREVAVLGKPPVVQVQDAAPITVQAITPVATSIRRLALHPDTAELGNPAVSRMYTALTEAVGKAGLQRVRVCDVADDAGAVVMVFGAAAVPAGVPLVRVLRADPLSVLHADRERKRLLWERLQALGRDGGE